MKTEYTAEEILEWVCGSDAQPTDEDHVIAAHLAKCTKLMAVWKRAEEFKTGYAFGQALAEAISDE